MDIQRELVFLDIDTLGNDSLDHHTWRQARHRQMGGLLRACLVPVNGTGYIVGGRVSFRDLFAIRIAHDETVDVELLECRVEVELQRAEICSALCVLHLDLLHLRPEQGFASVERITGDPIQEPGAVAFDSLVERRIVDERAKLDRQGNRSESFADTCVLSFAEDVVYAREVILDDGTGRRIFQRGIERFFRFQVRLELVFRVSLVEVALEGTVVLFDEQIREPQHVGRPVQLVEHFDLCVGEVGTERTVRDDAVEHRECFLVVPASAVKLRLQFPQSLGHALRGIPGKLGFDLIPVFPIGQEACIQRKLVVFTITLAEQIRVDTQGLVSIVVLVGEPGVPAAYDEIVAVTREPRLPPCVSFLVGVDLDEYAKRIHDVSRLAGIEVGGL